MLLTKYCFFFFSFLSHPSPTVLIPALRTVGNIVTGDDGQTQVWTIICTPVLNSYHVAHWSRSLLFTSNCWRFVLLCTVCLIFYVLN
jgi:hypothetical protein